jgi:hypothetical protein
MMEQVFVPVMKFNFSTPEIFRELDTFSKSGYDGYCKLYTYLCAGGFKEPFDVFAVENLTRVKNANASAFRALTG